jgi:hypothetical protein
MCLWLRGMQVTLTCLLLLLLLLRLLLLVTARRTAWRVCWGTTCRCSWGAAAGAAVIGTDKARLLGGAAGSSCAAAPALHHPCCRA